jgi:hypothetical protein
MTEPTNDKDSADNTSANHASPDETFVSQLYHASKQAGPEQSIDNKILAMAKKELNLGPATSAKPSSPKPIPWWKQMQYQGATAASVLIVCLVFLLQPQTANIVLHDPSLAISPAKPLPQSVELAEEAALADLKDQDMPVQSELAKREDKASRYKVQADEMAAVTQAQKSMDTFASMPSPHEDLLAENDVILKKLSEIQATLALSHSQITEKAERPDLTLSLTNESEQNNLVKEYLAQHKKMKDNLSKLLAGSSDLSILEPYSDVLSTKEIQALRDR